MRALLAVALFPIAAAAASYDGIVSHVTDGDTVWVRPASGGPPQQVRLEGIDAPEICQAFGRESQGALAQYVLNRKVVVNSRAEDDYGRTVARIKLGRADVGRWMVSHGYAWSYRFRGDAGPYRRQEARAREQRLGLWAHDDPEMPRDFRVRHGSCH
jgi:endonuclease YncB( thermonuclease family)